MIGEQLIIIVTVEYDDKNYRTMNEMHVRGVYPDEGRAQCKLCNRSSICSKEDWFIKKLPPPKSPLQGDRGI